MTRGIPFFPDSASTVSGNVDLLFLTLLLFSVSLGAFLTILVVRYAVLYRASARTDRSGRRRRNLSLEITWISATLVAAFALFAWGATLFVDHQTPPDGALKITGIGKQWMWKFRHPGGQREINELHVPAGRPVLITFGSQDVIHSFYVPAFRVKQDVVPGRQTHIWFEATREGRFRLFCAEYCGTQHSRMGGWVHAMAPEDYADWLEEAGAAETLAAAGERLFRSLGCSGCHGAASQVRAPTLVGVHGRPVPVEIDGEVRTVIADERYLRDSILLPKKAVVAGYRPIMPSFDGLIDEPELQMLVAYLKSLSSEEPAP